MAPLSTSVRTHPTATSVGRTRTRFPGCPAARTRRWTSSLYSSIAPIDSCQVSAGQTLLIWLLGTSPLSDGRTRSSSTHSAYSHGCTLGDVEEDRVRPSDK